MKKEDKRKLCNKIFIRIFLILMVAFTAIYASSATGYYEFEQHKKTVLTEEKIKEFEKDVKEGKNINIKDYIIDEEVSYQNALSKFGDNISNNLSNFMKTGVNGVFEFLNKMISG